VTDCDSARLWKHSRTPLNSDGFNHLDSPRNYQMDTEWYYGEENTSVNWFWSMTNSYSRDLPTLVFFLLAQQISIVSCLYRALAAINWFVTKWKIEFRFIVRDTGIFFSSWSPEPQLISCPKRLRNGHNVILTATFREEKIKNSWKFNLLWSVSSDRQVLRHSRKLIS
jgi:hypothetical protein